MNSRVTNITILVQFILLSGLSIVIVLMSLELDRTQLQVDEATDQAYRALDIIGQYAEMTKTLQKELVNCDQRLSARYRQYQSNLLNPGWSQPHFGYRTPNWIDSTKTQKIP